MRILDLPLLSSCNSGNTALARLLMLKARQEDEDIDLTQYLDMAAEKGFLEIVKMLVQEFNAYIYQDDTGFSPLVSAAKNGHTDIVKFLLSVGANAGDDLESGFAQNALRKAVKFNHFEIVRALLNAGVHMPVDPFQQVFWWAAEKNPGILKPLIGHGATIDLNIIAQIYQSNITQFPQEKEHFKTVHRSLKTLAENQSKIRVEYWAYELVQELQALIRHGWSSLPLPALDLILIELLKLRMDSIAFRNSRLSADDFDKGQINRCVNLAAKAEYYEQKITREAVKAVLSAPKEDLSAVEESSIEFLTQFLQDRAEKKDSSMAIGESSSSASYSEANFASGSTDDDGHRAASEENSSEDKGKQSSRQTFFPRHHSSEIPSQNGEATSKNNGEGKDRAQDSKRKRENNAEDEDPAQDSKRKREKNAEDEEPAQNSKRKRENNAENEEPAQDSKRPRRGP